MTIDLGPRRRQYEPPTIVRAAGRRLGDRGLRFGGSVPALRLAEKGYDVLVLEQGRRFEDADFAKTAREVRQDRVGADGSVCRGSWPSPPSSTSR